MDYRNLLATGFILLCGAIFIHSLKSANAFPQGPNVSIGSNPVHSFVGQCNSSTPQIFSTTSAGFVITDIVHPDFGYESLLTLSTSSVTLIQDLKENNSNFPVSSFNTGLFIPPNEPLYCYTNYGRNVTISGYYAHP